MSTISKKNLTVAGIAVVVLAAAGVGIAIASSSAKTNDAASASPSASAAPAASAVADPIAVTVGASPTPHALILQFIQDNLAADAGITLDIVEFDDYVLPNEALAAGELDANYFQHLPYLNAQIAEKGFEFTPGEGVHIEPYAAFSSKYDSIDKVPDGATIAITNDAANQIRGLRVLETAGLLTGITDESNVLNLTADQNPHGLKFIENQPEIIVQQLEDPAIDVAFVNGNFILQAGLSTSDAIAVESVKDNPNSNLLVWRTDNTNEGVSILEELLHSQDVADFITATWPNGDVIPGK